MNPLRVAALLLVWATFLSPAFAGPLEGRWRLVEQKLGEGESGGPPEPLEIEFAREKGRLSGRLYLGDGRDRRDFDWPALPAPGGALPVTVLELYVSPAEDRIRVRFRTQLFSGGAESVEIVEDYQVVEGGGSLAGKVTVSVPGGGSYRLRRRFERLP